MLPVLFSKTNTYSDILNWNVNITIDQDSTLGYTFVTTILYDKRSRFLSLEELEKVNNTFNTS